MVGAVRQVALAGRGGHLVEGWHHGEDRGGGKRRGRGEPEDQEDRDPLPGALLCALPQEDFVEGEEEVSRHGESVGVASDQGG